MQSLRGQVMLNMAAEKAWMMYRDNVIISKINPQMLSSAEYIHGDGNPGSVRLFRLGPAVSNYVKESIEQIESVEPGRSVTYRVVGGGLKDMYDPYIVTFTFTPITGEEEEKCVAEWKAEFELLDPSTPPPEQARDAALGFLSSFDEFQQSY